MKKLLLSVIAFALITTSCNKYKDDFKNLNARLDALAAQIQGVSTLVAGIQASQLTLAQVTAAIGTATGPLATQLTNLTNTVNGIQTTLATVAAGTLSNTQALAALTTLVNNNQIAALAAIAGIQTSLTNAIASINLNTNTQITAAITALDASILAAQININAATVLAVTNAQNALTTLINTQFGTTNANIAALALQLTNATTLLNNAITAAQAAIIADNANQTVILTALINQLQLSLNIANANLLTLLSSNNFFIGDLTITNETELTAAEALGAKVNVVTGNVLINTTGFTAGQMTRLKAVTNGVLASGPNPPARIYIGNVTGNVTILGPNVIDLGSLVNINNNTNSLAPGNFTSSGAAHKVGNLLSVKGDYTVNTVDIEDDALQNVGGNMLLNYATSYTYPNLVTITGTLTTVDGIGVSTVSFPVMTSVTSIDANTPVWAWATSVNLRSAGGIRTLSMGGALGTHSGSLTLGQVSYTNGFEINAPWVTTTNMSAVTISGSGLANPTWSFVAFIGYNHPTTTATTVNLNSWTTSSQRAYIQTTGSSSLSTINANAFASAVNLELYGPQTQSLNAYLNGDISSNTIRTLTMNVYRGNAAPTNAGVKFANLSALRTLTLGDFRANIAPADFVNLTTLQNLTVTMSNNPAGIVDMTGITSLISVSTAGILDRLILDGNSSLTSVATAGQMDRITVNASNALTTLNGLAHTIKVLGSTGSYVIVTNNTSLISMTTSTSYLKQLTITGNTALTSANLGSYIAGQHIASGTVTMEIFNNSLSGTYTQGVFSTSTPTAMTQASIAGFKAYALSVLANGALVGSFIDFGYRIGVGTNAGFITALDADRAQFIADGGLGTTTYVQRDADAGGAAGSRINVARELGYLN